MKIFITEDGFVARMNMIRASMVFNELSVKRWKDARCESFGEHIIIRSGSDYVFSRFIPEMTSRHCMIARNCKQMGFLFPK